MTTNHELDRAAAEAMGHSTTHTASTALPAILAELADLRAYKDRTEALIDRALMLAATGAKPPQAEGQAEPMLTINAEVRRRMRSVLAVLTEAKGLWRDPPQAEVKP